MSTSNEFDRFVNDGNNFPFLSNFLDDKIREIASDNNLDISAAKSKAERIKVIEVMPCLYIRSLGYKPPAENFPQLKLPKLTAEEDIVTYLEKFEFTCRARAIQQKFWPALLAPLLTGPAERAWSFLPDNQKNDWSDLREQIEHAYNLGEHSYRNRLNNTVKQKGSTFLETGNIAMMNLKRWLKPSSSLAVIPEFQTILDKIVLNQLLLHIIDETLRLKIMESQLSLEKTLQLCDDYMKNRFSHKVSSPSTNSSSNRQNSSKSPGSVSPGKSFAPSDSKASPTKSKPNITCYHCSEPGHKANECPRKKKSNASTEKSGPREGFITDHDDTEDLITKPLLRKLEQPAIHGAFTLCRISGHGLLAYVDSGASVSILQPSVADDLEARIKETDVTLSLLDNSPLRIYRSSISK